MTELELQQYLLREYPQENARCEWNVFNPFHCSLSAIDCKHHAYSKFSPTLVEILIEVYIFEFVLF